MGSRARIAAAACVLTAGLFVGGGAFAYANPSHEPDDGVAETNQGQNNQSPSKPNDATSATPGDDESVKDADGDDRDGDEGEPGEATDPDVVPPEEEDPDEVGGCEEKNDDDCEPNWPWWPWPWPPGDGLEAGGGGGRDAAEVPSGRPDLPPEMQLPEHLLSPAEPPEPVEPVSAVPGAVIAAPEVALAPINLPVIVVPPAGIGIGAGGGGAAATAPAPRAPEIAAAEPPAVSEPPPASELGTTSGQVMSYRAGYADYLRHAGMSQVFVLAAPGLAGMLALTGAGGLVGYRQAKAGHAVRTGAAARFVN